MINKQEKPETSANLETNANQVQQYRRRFLTNLGIGAGMMTIAPGVMLQVSAKHPAQAVSSAQRWGMLFRTDKINEQVTDKIVSACQKEHGWGNDPKSTQSQQAQWVRKVKVTEKTTKHSVVLPVMCQHCETAPCVDVCPTGASYKRVDGIVKVDKHICIGCRYCMMACPYKARSFVHEPLTDQKPDSPRGIGTVESCNMCATRVDAGKKPACVEATGDAIIFGDLNDPGSGISKALKQLGGEQIRADLGLNTGVRYTEL